MDKLSNNLIEFTLVYNRHKSALYYYIYKMLNEKMVAEDILQNVFLKFFQNMEAIKNRDAIAAWIYRTARNEIYEHLRKKRSRPEFPEEDLSYIDANDYLEGLIERKELKALIISELKTMPPEQREVYLLKEYADLSYKEISAILEIEEELVKSRLFKARKKLIERISKLI